MELTIDSSSVRRSSTDLISVSGLTVRFTSGIDGSRKRVCWSSSFDATSRTMMPPGESANA
jgi:hypothetical protein